MPKKIEMVGKRFGYLVVLEQVEDAKCGQKRWKCMCDCGKETIAYGQSLRSGHTSSCGCYRSKVNAILGKEKLEKHGGCGTRLYHIWNSMKARCYDPKRSRYKQYGGRGIIVCDEWRNDFAAFRSWALANGYNDSFTIDRIDNDGPYSPSNCRWITNFEQQGNKRNNRNLEYNGQTHTVAEWARITGISENTIRQRLRNGWSVDDALTRQVGNV